MDAVEDTDPLRLLATRIEQYDDDSPVALLKLADRMEAAGPEFATKAGHIRRLVAQGPIGCIAAHVMTFTDFAGTDKTAVARALKHLNITEDHLTEIATAPNRRARLAKLREISRRERT